MKEKRRATDIPCKDCVCVPVCRHKRYRDLYMQCQLLKNYLVYFLAKGDKQFVFFILHDTLKPTKWNTTYSGNIETDQGYVFREEYGDQN